jgi:hypothetical protein
LAAQSKLKPFVDQFGQCAIKSWPGKVTSEQDLARLRFSADTPAADKDMDDFLALYCDTYGCRQYQLLRRRRS